MGSTVIEQLLGRASEHPAPKPGDTVVVDVDLTVLIDLQFQHDRLHHVLQVHDPDKIAVVMDHAVPAPSIRDASGGERAREFARSHGVSKFYDVGRHGIVHQVIAEQALALPGQNLACTDSHTCAAGALNVAARGLGPAEVLQIVCTGKTWHMVPPTIRYDLVGQKPDHINGKDIFLHIAGTYGEATDHAIEYGGPGLSSVPMSDRRTMAAQGAEVGADFSVFPADEVCLESLGDRARDAHPCNGDDDARYAVRRSVDLSALKPMVSKPGTVINNSLPVSELEDKPIHQAFIGDRKSVV